MYFGKVIGLVVGLFPSTAIPQANAAEKGDFVIIGAGNASCGSWIDARRERSWLAFVYEGWVAGYFTSYNEWADTGEMDILKNTDMEGVSADIDKFCSAHPLSNITEATVNVLDEILKEQMDSVIDNLSK